MVATVLGWLNSRPAPPPEFHDGVAVLFEAAIVLGFILLPAMMALYSFSYRGLEAEQRPTRGRYLVGWAIGLLVGVPFGMGWMPFWALLACLVALEAANRLRRPRAAP